MIERALRLEHALRRYYI
jgi:hypothetical protein